jgi:hypothetical protein
MKRTQILIVVLIFSVFNALGQDLVNFSGVIKDAQTGNPLEGINVFITEKNTGTISNDTGEFFVFLASGIYNVSISANGYKTEKMTLDLREDNYAEILLVPSTDPRKKNDLLTKGKSNLSNEVLIGKQKSKTVKSS